MGILTPYSTGSAPLYYGSGYISHREFWMLGLVFGALHLATLLGAGNALPRHPPRAALAALTRRRRIDLQTKASFPAGGTAIRAAIHGDMGGRWP